MLVQIEKTVFKVGYFNPSTPVDKPVYVQCLEQGQRFETPVTLVFAPGQFPGADNGQGLVVSGPANYEFFKSRVEGKQDSHNFKLLPGAKVKKVAFQVVDL